MTTSDQSCDPLLIEIQQELMPGRYVRYDDMDDFARHLHQVEEKIAALVETGEAARAVGLYEIFLAGAYEKIEECDDSKADLSMFWTYLFCGWIKARQAAGRSAAETVEQILNWQENDDYGYCYEIERDVVQVLDAEGYRHFVLHYEQLVDDGLAALQGPRPEVIFEYDNSIRLPAMSLKDIYRARGDVASYAALCERMGFSPKDCERLAEMEMAKGHWAEALAWVEKGLELEPTRNWHNESSSSLKSKKPEILGKLGREDESLAMAWADFEKHPSDFAYERFMEYVPQDKRTQWHERAMEYAERGDIGDFMDICVSTGEWSALASRIHATPHAELESVSHYHMEPAAEGLMRRTLPAAAKLYRALGLRILQSKKSKYYDAALSHLRRARDLCLVSALNSEWESVVEAVRARHSRKYSFMPGFERLVAGESGAESGPSFEEKAKARWARQVSVQGDDPEQ